MTEPSATPGDAARRAAAEAARRAVPAGGRQAPPSSPGTVLRPTAAQHALVPVAWGLSALVVAALLPLGGVGVLLLAAAVAVGAWLLAGRSAVVLTPGELVVRHPVGRTVVPLADVRAVERHTRAFTERAEVVRADGSRLPLPAPQNGPHAALRDPAFDERITLIRYRVAKGTPPAGS